MRAGDGATGILCHQEEDTLALSVDEAATRGATNSVVLRGGGEVLINMEIQTENDGIMGSSNRHRPRNAR